MAAAGVEKLLNISISLVIYSITIATVYYIGQLIYNAFFHPLASYPGPLLWRASRLPFCVQNIRGTLAFNVLDMFEKYGPVVRIAPNELAYADPDAWREILGHNPNGEENGKYRDFYRPAEDMPETLISADRELHGKLRRQLSHGFSDRNMRAQEPIIKAYIDMLIGGLREHCVEGRKALDMCMWYNFATFDIIGDLAFGQPFGCLKTAERHPWVETMFKVTELSPWIQSTIHYPAIKNILINNVPKEFKEANASHTEFAMRRVQARMDMGATRPDLIEGLLVKQTELALPLDDIVAHANLLIVAGSETTATVLSGVTYLLARHPDKLARLTEEVRGAFASEADIEIASVGRLSYMLACLDEALRLYPPVPTGLPRVVPRGGKTLCGQYVPEGTHVGIWQWATSHYSSNFVEPFAYHPERSLEGENERFAADKREAVQPFSYGPRNCIGKNLAYAEMRTILARVIFNFDLTLAPECEEWMAGQRVYNLWSKPPLMVYLRPRV